MFNLPKGFFPTLLWLAGFGLICLVFLLGAGLAALVSFLYQHLQFI